MLFRFKKTFKVDFVFFRVSSFGWIKLGEKGIGWRNTKIHKKLFRDRKGFKIGNWQIHFIEQ